MSQDGPVGPVPRTPRTEVRRRLLAAAMRVFAERGYINSRLEDIAHAAGFTKGAIYSHFGSKQGLFGAVLAERADTQLAVMTGEIQDAKSPGEAAGRAAHAIAQRIVNDPERGRLGLEFAAFATRDEQASAILSPLRRRQRAVAAKLVSDAAGHTGARLAVSPDLAALILHCLTNGLSMEHLADPGSVDATAVEQAISTAIAALFALTPTDTSLAGPQRSCPA